MALALIGAPLYAQAQSNAAAAASRHLQWQELVPKGWDPAKQVRERLQGKNVDTLSDDDPQVLELMRRYGSLGDPALGPLLDGAQRRFGAGAADPIPL